MWCNWPGRWSACCDLFAEHLWPSSPKKLTHFVFGTHGPCLEGAKGLVGDAVGRWMLLTFRTFEERASFRKQRTGMNWSNLSDSCHSVLLYASQDFFERDCLKPIWRRPKLSILTKLRCICFGKMACYCCIALSPLWHQVATLPYRIATRMPSGSRTAECKRIEVSGKSKAWINDNQQQPTSTSHKITIER